MIGAILQMYAYGLLENNLEELIKAYSKGGTYKMDTGLLGKGINKVTGGKIPSLTHTFKAAQSGTGKAMALGAGILGKAFFHPAAIATRMAVGYAWDKRKSYIEDEMNKHIFNMPSETDRYILDQRFQGVSNNTFNDMERVNYTINELLNSGNLAGSMIDRVFSNL